MNFRRRPACLACALVFLASGPAPATMLTWDGDGPGDNWSALDTTPGGSFGRTNWVGAFLRPSNGDDLLFAGRSRLDNRNDFPLLSVRHLSFAAGAGAFLLGGNGLLLQGNVTNASTLRQTLNLGLTLTGASTWDGGTGGLSVFGGVNVGDTQLTLRQQVEVSNSLRDWVVGDAAAGRLSLDTGSSVAVAGMALALKAGSSGQLDLTGAGTTLGHAGDLLLGQAGDAFVTVAQGALLDGSTNRFAVTTLGGLAGSRGQIWLSGPGTTWQLNDHSPGSDGRAYIGMAGEGRVLIEGGAQWMGGSPVLGGDVGSLGVVTVSGQGSQWRTGRSVTVGDLGRGELTVLNGARAVLGGVTVAAFDSGQVTVRGTGSELDISSNITLGLYGDGHLDVIGGGRISAASVTLGGAVGGIGGTWLLSDVGSSATVTRRLLIGLQTTGRLMLRQGATLDSRDTTFGSYGEGSGTAEVRDGAVWRNGGFMDIGSNGSGQLIVGTGASVTTDSLQLGISGRADLLGGLLHAGTLTGSGRLAWSGGTLQVDQDLALGAQLAVATTLNAGMHLGVGRTLTVGQGATLTFSGGSVAAGTLLVDGGRIAAKDAGRLDLSGVQTLRARGHVDVAIGGGARSIIEASGPLSIGDASLADGFLYDGTLIVGSQRVELQSAAAARLGRKTLLDRGAELVAAAGLLLPDGARLSAAGDGTIDARLQHAGTLSSSGGTLTLRGDVGVGGTGRFEGGAFAFEAGFSTGGEFIEVDFGGADAHFGPQSTLTLKIGDHVDRLAGLSLLEFHGTLRLVFDSPDSFAQGATLDLLDFDTLGGGFDAAHLVVSGLSASRLHLDGLNVDGMLLISAVPEPPPAGLLLAGLALLLTRAWPRRLHAAAPRG